ncbi:hypothetical protein Glove_350g105 [Diversispora epigaea]|uniref:Protein kinase domain-containing protein n=1 Tax=Diversispora epigaea TaxID=1348612 RepID=A0A397HCP8_9GLOM|nr:hypothetical protein Glove_350g105 [Diversispora epigaea]
MSQRKKRKINNNIITINNNSKASVECEEDIPFYHYSKFENVKLINENVKNVYKAHIKKIDSQQEKTAAEVVALKYISLNNLINEVKRHRKLEINDSILKFYGITKQENIKNYMNYMIVLEYSNNGSLRQYLKINSEKFDWNIKLNLAKQISNALMNLHDNIIIHGKLTSESILVHNGIIKLNDFGINYLKSLTTTVTIPIQYTDFRYLELFNKSLDIYSLGIILWEITNDGISPFEKKSITKSSLPSSTSTNNNIIDLINDTIAKLKREKNIPEIPPKYKEIYIDCLKHHGSSRPDIFEVVNGLSEINIISDINAKNKLEEIPSINSKTNNYNITFIKKLFEFFINIFIIQPQEMRPIMIKNYVREHNLNPVKILHIMIRYPSHYWFTSLIGFFYQHGIGTVIDNQMAFKFFNLSSNERIYMKNISLDLSLRKFYNINKEIGIIRLAYMYLHGIGVKKDLKKGFRIYSKAADEGSNVALNCMAYCYYLGLGIEKNEEKAFELYLKSAEKGNPVARFNASQCYIRGRGIVKDEAKGFQLHLKSALAGNINAINNAGYCYDSGVGVGVDKKEAFKWFFKGVEKGYPRAQYNLGRCYANGYGINQDQVKAFEWYKKSAENEYADGQYMVGKYFYEGRGTRKDIIKSIYWLNKAKENGNITANESLEVKRHRKLEINDSILKFMALLIKHKLFAIPIQYTDFRYLELFNKSLDIYSLGIILWEISNDVMVFFLWKELITKSSLVSPTSTNNNIIDLLNDFIIKEKSEKTLPGIPPKYKEIYIDIFEVVNGLSDINVANNLKKVK